MNEVVRVSVSESCVAVPAQAWTPHSLGFLPALRPLPPVHRPPCRPVQRAAPGPLPGPRHSTWLCHHWAPSLPYAPSTRPFPLGGVLSRPVTLPPRFSRRCPVRPRSLQCLAQPVAADPSVCLAPRAGHSPPSCPQSHVLQDVWTVFVRDTSDLARLKPTLPSLPNPYLHPGP